MNAFLRAGSTAVPHELRECRWRGDHDGREAGRRMRTPHKPPRRRSSVLPPPSLIEGRLEWKKRDDGSRTEFRRISPTGATFAGHDLAVGLGRELRLF